MFTSWMSGMAVQPSFLSVAPIFLSSDDAVLCIVFFFRRAVPLPPVRESAATPPKRRAIIFSRASLMSMAGIDAGGATCGALGVFWGGLAVPGFYICALATKGERLAVVGGAASRRVGAGGVLGVRRGGAARE